MSKTIDERVVSLEFDNKRFEQNVSTTMSTLDKLKKSLNLPGSAKGLENINSAAKKVDMQGLANGVETVKARFSALDVIGVTALANITNSAVNAGKKIVSALTIDPVKTGFQEYETQINAVQTILANTSSKGTTIDDVNWALEELNKYADMTIYNFTEMTRNIGTFTAAGIDLDTSVNAIQGIANLAAVSGSTSQQASTAMYQLSQALAAGTVKLMDWNSVVNAGMGGEVFQNALRETSELLGTGAEAAIASAGSFRESLRYEWLTADVLTETLKKVTTSGANEYIAEYTGLSFDAVAAELEMIDGAKDEAAAIDQVAETLAKKSGKNKQEIKDALEMAYTAQNAATKVKTFTQLWDVLKESAQSGWSQSWKIIIGDFEEAKALLTPLADILTGFINKMSDARNAVLESALGRTIGDAFDGIDKLFEEVTDAVDAVTEPIDKVTEAMDDLGAVVDEVIMGKFGNGKDRWNALAEAGYNHYRVQNKVNEQLGNTYRHSEELIKAEDERLGRIAETIEKTEEEAEATTKLTDKQKEKIKQLAEMSYEQARAAGYTDQQIEAMNELRDVAKSLGIPFEDFIDNLDQINGRFMLIQGFKNIGNGIVGVFRALGDAWANIFPETSTENLADGLFNLITAFSRLTYNLRVNEDTAEKWQRTFQGVFAALDIVLKLVGGPLKLVFNLIKGLLGALDIPILDVTATLGDMIVILNDVIESALDFESIFISIFSFFKSAPSTIQKWFASFKDSKIIKAILPLLDAAKMKFLALVDSIKQTKVFESITALLTPLINKINSFVNRVKELYGDGGLAGLSSIVEYLFSGLVRGIEGGASTVWNAISEVFITLIEKVKAILGIHSPSTVFAAIGGFIIAGLIAGLQNGIPDSLGAFKDVFQPMLDWLKGIDLGAVMAAIIGVGTLKLGNNLVNVLGAFASPLEGLGEVFEGTGEVLKKSAKPIKKILNNTAKVVKSFSKVLSSFAFSIRIDAIVKLVKALVLLAAAVAVLSFLDQGKLWSAVGAITALAIVLGALMFFANKIGSSAVDISKEGVKVDGLMLSLLSIGAAILLMGITAKMLGNLTLPQIIQGTIAIGYFAGLLIALMAATEIIRGNSNIDAIGSSLLKIGAALLLMGVTVKMIGGLDLKTLGHGAIAMTYFAALIVALMAATQLIGKGDNVGAIGSTLLKIGAAFLLMGLTVKMVGSLDLKTLGHGSIALGYFAALIAALMGATQFIAKGENIDKIGSTLLKIGAVFLLMGLTVKMLGGMKPDALIKGAVAVGYFTGLIIALMAATQVIGGGPNVDKIGKALLAVSGAISIMAFTAFMLGMASPEGLAKGMIMVTKFSAIIVALMAATKLIGGSENVDKIGKTLISVAGAIAILAAVAVAIGLVPIPVLAKGIVVVAILSGLMMGLMAASKNVTSSMGSIIAMTAAIVIFAGLLILLSELEVTNSLANAAALSLLLIAMSAALFILSKTGPMVATALIGAGLMLALCIPLLAFVGILALMQNIQNATTNAIILAGLAATLTLLLIPLSMVGSLAVLALAGVFSLLALCVPLLAFVGILALMQNIQNAEQNAQIITQLMATMTICLLAISLVAPLAVVAVVAIGALTAVMVAIGALVIGIGALMECGVPLDTFVNNALPLLNQIALGIGEMLGNFIKGFATSVMSILPMIAMQLTAFAVGIQPFIMLMSNVDASLLEQVAIITGAILLLTAAELITSMTSFLSVGSSFAQMGADLSAFAIAAMPFFAITKGIDESAMKGIKMLAEAMIILTANDLLTGLTSWFTGGSSFADFGAQLPQLGTDLNSFITNLGTFGEDQLKTVEVACDAIKTLAEAADTIPNEGGWAGKIFGENGLGAFSDNLPTTATAINSFITNLGEFDQAKLDTVDIACQAIKKISEAADTIPNEGGWAAKIFGDNGLSAFSEDLGPTATALMSFVGNLGAFNEQNLHSVDLATQAISKIATVANSLPKEEGFWQKLFGENSLATFSDTLPGLGSNLKAFTTNAGDVSADVAARVVMVMNSIMNLSSATGDSGKKLKSLGENIKDFGSNTKSFSTTVSEIDTDKLSKAMESLKELSKFAETFGKTDTAAFKTFSDSLKSLATNGVKSFTEELASDSAAQKAEKAAKKLLNSYVDGIKDNISDGEDAAEELAESSGGATDTATAYQDAWDGGDNVAKGFAAGISDNTFKATAKAKAMAEAALAAAKEALRENSPSKAFYELGDYAGIGFVNALSDSVDSAGKAGSTLARSSIDGLKGAMSLVNDIVSSDISAQPTIRPVLDLTSVRDGARSIGSMLNGRRTISVDTSYIDSVASSMYGRQNGSNNDDVVKAIRGLQKDLADMPRNNYNFGGITYGDDSAVSEAVLMLVRALKMDGRA